MSPIASVSTAFAFSAATSSIDLDPDSAGQYASTVSQYLSGTGGAVFAAVAIVSVAGYFYHGRRTANNAQKNSAWATFSNFLSSMRHRGSDAITAPAGSSWPPDVEGGFEQHVSMVYARFFHPTFWNLVECHPATPSTPAIYVEDEASEIPASEPKPYGTNSFLDMDDDDDDDGEGGDGDKNARIKARERADQDMKLQAAKVPPYDTSSVTHVRFKSVIIGVTDRSGGAFLCVPGKCQEGSSNASSCDGASATSSVFEGNVACSPCNGVPTECEVDFTGSSCDGMKHARMPDSILGTLTVSELALELNGSKELTCSAYDGDATDSHPDIDRLANDGAQTTPTRSFSGARRYGMADMADLARTLEHTMSEEGSILGLRRTIGRRSGLCDLTEFDDTDSEANSAASYGHLERTGPADDQPMDSSCYIGACDGARQNWSDSDAFEPTHEDLMRQILEELRDPNMECLPRDLTEYDDELDDIEDDVIANDEGNISRLAPTWGLDKRGWISLERTSSAPGTDSDVSESDGGSICPLTPPLRVNTLALSPPCVRKARMSPQAASWRNEEAQVVMPMCSVSPLRLPSKPCVRAHGPGRALPMVCDPTWLPY